MLRTTNQAAIWNMFASICERKDWAVIYFDAVHRCSTDRNVHISIDEFRKKEIKWGIFAFIGFPVIHLMQYTYPVEAVGRVDTVKDSDLSHSWSKKFLNTGNVRIDILTY